MQPTWDYAWNSCTGDAIYDEKKVNELQELVNRPFPSHVWKAVANARQIVLSRGEFKDSDMSEEHRNSLQPDGIPAEIFKALCPAATTPAQQPQNVGTVCDQCDHKPHWQDTEQSLSEELASKIEEAASSSGGKLRLPGWDLPGARTSALTLDGTDELNRHGFLVLNKVPLKRTAHIDKALCAQDGGQGVMFMDGAELALKSAERLKEVSGMEEVLYARVFQRQRECHTGATSAEYTKGKCDAEEPLDVPACGEAACDKTRRRESGASEREGGPNHSDFEGSESRADGPSRGAEQSSGSCLPIVSWLLVVATYLSSLPDGKWKIIFQKGKGTKEERSGDERRSELKGDKWERPTRMEGDSHDRFWDKMAGYYALIFFYDALFNALTNILPIGSNISAHLFKTMHSVLSSDGREGDVEAQDPHNDIRPVRSLRRFSALFNLSELFSYVGILVNSCPNIKAMFDFEDAEFHRFEQLFLKTKSCSQPGKLLSEVMGKEKMEAKVRFAWGHYFAMNRPKQFRGMYPVYAKMPPVMIALFDTDTVHWGAPFPMPGIEYPLSGYRVIHYR
jgi:hypothetical protein